MVVLDVVNQLLQEITLIVSLKQIVVNILGSFNMLVVLTIELVIEWWLHLLIEV